MANIAGYTQLPQDVYRIAVNSAFILGLYKQNTMKYDLVTYKPIQIKIYIYAQHYSVIVALLVYVQE